MTVKNRLSSLDVRTLGEFSIDLQNVLRGRFPNETRFDLFLKRDEDLSLSPIIRGTFFPGEGYYSPWLEIYFRKKGQVGLSTIDLQEKQLDVTLFTYLSELLPPGSHMMVSYSNHETTHKALQRGFPPPTTYLGFLLWKAGCTWFKDWYFPEGGKEGGFKLQGNKAPHEEGRNRQILKMKKEMKNFLKRETNKSNVSKNAKKRAQIILRHISV